MTDFVEQKIFTLEVKRLDSEITSMKKAEERQNKTVSEAINGLRADMKNLESGLRADMKELRNEVRGEIKELRSEMHSNFRWLIGMYITGFMGTLAAFYYFASYIRG